MIGRAKMSGHVSNEYKVVLWISREKMRKGRCPLAFNEVIRGQLLT
jgi:hypothetical protein